MQSEWAILTLGEICSTQGGSIQTGPFGSQLHASDYESEGIPVVMPANIGEGGINQNGIARVSNENADRLAQHKLEVGDIVFSRRGDVTKNALVRPPQVGWLCGTGCLKVRVGDQSRALPEFIAYALRLPRIKEWLIRHAVGATMPNINTSILAAVPIHLPPLPEQRNIISVLSVLDEQIALLRETNATLEAIAQALFKSWFVDFDPVRAKQAGRQPEGMDAETAMLFPDGLEESELGIKPKGWQLSYLQDAYDINPGRRLSKGVSAPYLDMANVPIAGHSVDTIIHREMGSGTKFINEDTLLARITPCLENGKAAFVDFLASGDVGWGSTEFIVLRPKAPLPAYHAYLLCRHNQFRDHAIQSMSGTSGRQRIQNDVLGAYPIAVPTHGVANAFASIVTPIQQKITSNAHAAKTLADLRDTLLPRLISGQLRLPEAAEQTHEALTAASDA